MAGPFNIISQLQLQSPANLQSVVSDIQQKLSGINANVNIQVTNAQEIAAIQQTMRATAAETKEAATAMENFGIQAGLAARRYSAFLLAGGAIVGVINELRSATKEAISFQHEIVKLTQVSNESISAIKGISSEVTRLSTTLGVSSKDLISVASTLAQAGLSATETKTALEALAKTTLAPSFSNIVETTNGAIAAMAQFELKAGDLDKTLGSINAVANAYAVESKDLIEAISRTGGAFKAAGGNLNELLALFTSVRATTRESAESIATGLRTIFTRLERPTTLTSLQDLGIQLRYTREEAERLGNVNLTSQFVGPYEAVGRLSTALKGLQTTDVRYTAITEELGGYRQISKTIPLIQQFAKAQEAYQVAQAGSNSLTQASEQAQDAFVVKITKVREEFLALIRTVTESKSFGIFLDMVLNITSALTKLADTLTPIIPLLGALATFKIAQGAGRLLGGLSEGFLGQAPSFSKPPGFATGGVVPGVGNEDTTFARLTPGEFVIKKSSAQAIGYDKLSKVNKYADGGYVGDEETARHLLPGDVYYGNKYKQDASGKYVKTDEIVFAAKPDDKNPARPYYTAVAVGGKSQIDAAALGGLPNEYQKIAQMLVDNTALHKTTLPQGRIQKIEAAAELTAKGKAEGNVRITLPADIVGAIGSSGAVGSQDLPYLQISNATVRDKAKSVNANNNTYLAKASELLGNPNSTDLGQHTYIGGRVRKYTLSENKVNNEEVGFKSAVQGPIINTLAESFRKFGAARGVPDVAAEEISQLVDPKSLGNILSAPFESYIKVATRGLLKKEDSPNASFDYQSPIPENIVKEMNAFFDPGFISRYADAKYTLSTSNIDSLRGKALKSQVEGMTVEKFAQGGPKTDSVPSLLTPGEFVMSASSARAIGYQNLDRMNKTGVAHFAEGGIVQKLAGGTQNYLFDAFGRPIVGATQAGPNAAPLAPPIPPPVAHPPEPSDAQKYASQLATTLRQRSEAEIKLLTSKLGQLSDETQAQVIGRQVVTLKKQEVENIVKQLSGTASSYEAQLIAHQRVNEAFNALAQAHNTQAKNASTASNRDNAIFGRGLQLPNEPGFTGPPLSGRERFKAALPNILGTAGFFAGSYAVSGLEHLAGQAPEAVRGGTTGSYQGLTGAAGLLGGAVTGATIGIGYGPQAAAIGAVIGGLVGLVTALKSVTEEINKAQLDIAAANLAAESARNAKTGAPLSGGVLQPAEEAYQKKVSFEANASALDKIYAAFGGGGYFGKEGEAKYYREEYQGPNPISSFFGVSNNTRETRRKATEEVFGKSQQSEIQRYGTLVEQQVKAGSNTDVPSLVTKILKDNLTDILHQGINTRDLRTSLESRGNTAVRDRALSGVTSDTTTIVANFEALVLSLRNASTKIDDFGKIISTNNALLTGQIAAVPTRDISSGINQLGAPIGDEFSKAIKDIGSIFGEQGKIFTSRGLALDDVKRAASAGLPGYVGSGSPFGTNYIEKFIEYTQKGIANPNADTKQILSIVERAFTAIGQPKIQEELRENPEAFIKKLFSSLTGPLQAAGNDISKQLKTYGDAVSSALTTYSQQVLRAAQLTDNASRLSVNAIRTEAEARGALTNTRGTAIFNLPLAQLQEGFNAPQRRLAAVGGVAAVDAFNPQVLGQALSQTIQAANEQRKIIQTAVPTTPAYNTAQEEFARLNRAAISLNEALTHLTDVSKRTAEIDERLNTLHQDEAARLGIRERYITGTPESQAQILQGTQLLELATKQKNLGGFGQHEIDTLFQFLSSNPNLLYKGQNVGDIKNQLLGSVQFPDIFKDILGLDTNKAQQKELYGQRVGFAKTGEEASTTLAQVTLAGSVDTLKEAQLANSELLKTLNDNLAAYTKQIADATEVIASTQKQSAAQPAIGKSAGGYMFAPRGTDTVPAMLTPGEFVVNRAATERHLPLLQAVNAGHLSSGGMVQYLATGSNLPISGGASPLLSEESIRKQLAAIQERLGFNLEESGLSKISVEDLPKKAVAQYNAKTQAIKLSPNIADEAKLQYSLSHEFGHHLSPVNKPRGVYANLASEVKGIYGATFKNPVASGINVGPAEDLAHAIGLIGSGRANELPPGFVKQYESIIQSEIAGGRFQALRPAAPQAASGPGIFEKFTNLFKRGQATPAPVQASELAPSVLTDIKAFMQSVEKPGTFSRIGSRISNAASGLRGIDPFPAIDKAQALLGGKPLPGSPLYQATSAIPADYPGALLTANNAPELFPTDTPLFGSKFHGPTRPYSAFAKEAASGATTEAKYGIEAVEKLRLPAPQQYEGIYHVTEEGARLKALAEKGGILGKLSNYNPKLALDLETAAETIGPKIVPTLKTAGKAAGVTLRLAGIAGTAYQAATEGLSTPGDILDRARARGSLQGLVSLEAFEQKNKAEQEAIKSIAPITASNLYDPDGIAASYRRDAESIVSNEIGPTEALGSALRQSVAPTPGSGVFGHALRSTLFPINVAARVSTAGAAAGIGRLAGNKPLRQEQERMREDTYQVAKAIYGTYGAENLVTGFNYTENEQARVKTLAQRFTPEQIKPHAELLKQFSNLDLSHIKDVAESFPGDVDLQTQILANANKTFGNFDITADRNTHIAQLRQANEEVYKSRQAYFAEQAQKSASAVVAKAPEEALPTSFPAIDAEVAQIAAKSRTINPEVARLEAEAQKNREEFSSENILGAANARSAATEAAFNALINKPERPPVEDIFAVEAGIQARIEADRAKRPQYRALGGKIYDDINKVRLKDSDDAPEDYINRRVMETFGRHAKTPVDFKLTPSRDGGEASNPFTIAVKPPKGYARGGFVEERKLIELVNASGQADFNRASYASLLAQSSGLPGLGQQLDYSGTSSKNIAYGEQYLNSAGVGIDTQAGKIGLFGKLRALYGAAPNRLGTNIPKWLLDEISPARRFNSGGIVNGSGVSDTTPALLSAGEFVLNARAASNIGYSNLQNANIGYYEDGGKVAKQAISTAPNPTENIANTFTQSISQLSGLFTGFDTAINNLGSVLSKIPSSINLAGAYTLSVNISGAEAFKGMQEEFQKMVQAHVSSAINRMIQAKFPDVGRYEDAGTSDIEPTEANA